ncbi:MAG: HD domain-containing protein [Proteobacteria bacterium]|nr:HD domain-containing protein [Pseudomonadota bacterium]MBU1738474.1 HD domain-containing protein [Pseudomonadota bacterium]
MNCLPREIESSASCRPPCDKCFPDYPLGQALTRKLRDLATSFLDADGGCHGIDHSERVHATSLAIGREMGAKLEVLSAAALLHDIGRRDEHASKGKICHAVRGAELAAGLLAANAFHPGEISEICHCIATHRFRDNTPPLSLEARILFDADKLDSIGAIGIGRAFLFAGQVGARLHNTEADVTETSPYTVEDTAYREFMVKLIRIRERMLTPPGRKMADERHDFMVEFFARLEMEINGGEPDARKS